MHPHPFDLSEFLRSLSKCTHGDNTSLIDAYQKFAPVMKVGIFDILQVIVPWAIAKIGSNILQA